MQERWLHLDKTNIEVEYACFSSSNKRRQQASNICSSIRCTAISHVISKYNSQSPVKARYANPLKTDSRVLLGEQGLPTCVAVAAPECADAAICS